MSEIEATPPVQAVHSEFQAQTIASLNAWEDGDTSEQLTLL